MTSVPALRLARGRGHLRALIGVIRISRVLIAALPRALSYAGSTVPPVTMYQCAFAHSLAGWNVGRRAPGFAGWR